MQDARALFEAVAGVLTLLAREAPLLVVVDDLQWSDTMSLRLLSFLLRRLAPSSSVCFMAAVRAEELAVAPFLRTVLQELEREQRFLPIEIPPMTRADSRTFVQALAPPSVAVDPASFFEQIWAISEGNPLVVVETVRDLEAEAPRSPRCPCAGGAGHSGGHRSGVRLRATPCRLRVPAPGARDDARRAGPDANPDGYGRCFPFHPRSRP
jgi:hypothetical protein